MPGKRLDLDRDDLVQKHIAGCSAGELARELGVTHKVIKRVLGSDYRVGRLAHLPEAEVVKSYISGESEFAIANRYGVSRNVVTRVLTIAGVPRRNQSAAETMRWSKMTSDERLRQVASAHDAARGRRHSFDELCKRALARQANPTVNVSPNETMLRGMLTDRGIVSVPQLAIGPYNCDIAIYPVAVEIWGGKWHFMGRHFARLGKRFRYILDAGWHILTIVLHDPQFPLTAAVADYVATYCDQIRREPTAVREYRVIWGAGKFTTGGSADDDKITVIPPFTCRRNPATGQYETIPR